MNGNDPRIAAVRDVDGTTYVISGTRSSDGAPNRIELLSSTTPDGEVQFSFDASGRLAAVSSAQVTFRLSYTASGSAMQSTDDEGNSIDTFTEGGNPVALAGSAGGQRQSSGLVGPTRVAEASFTSCGAPQDGEVFFDIQSAGSGVVARSIRARRIAEGRYQADIPSSESSLNIDVRVRSTAETFARTLRTVCESNRQNLPQLAAHCAALSGLRLAPNGILQRLGKITQFCASASARLNNYCAMANRDALTNDLVASLPEALTLYAPNFRLRARMIAVPSSMITNSLPFDGSAGFSFTYDDQATCPTIRLYNRSLGGQALPAPGGGTVMTARITLYYFLNGRPLAGVPQGGERAVRLTSVPPGSILQMTGTISFQKTIYNPDGSYSGWCPAATISAPGRFVPISNLPRITSTTLFMTGNPICTTGSGGLADVVRVEAG